MLDLILTSERCGEYEITDDLLRQAQIGTGLYHFNVPLNLRWFPYNKQAEEEFNTAYYDSFNWMAASSTPSGDTSYHLRPRKVRIKISKDQLEAVKKKCEKYHLSLAIKSADELEAESSIFHNDTDDTSSDRGIFGLDGDFIINFQNVCHDPQSPSLMGLERFDWNNVQRNRGPMGRFLPWV